VEIKEKRRGKRGKVKQKKTRKTKQATKEDEPKIKTTTATLYFE